MTLPVYVVKPIEHRFLSKTFAHELTKIQFAALAHLRRARVAEVRVVCPDDDLGRRPGFVEMLA